MNAKMFAQDEAAGTRWLDVCRTALGLGGPFLLERTDAYKSLRQSSRMVMLVRGGLHASFAGGF